MGAQEIQLLQKIIANQQAMVAGSGIEIDTESNEVGDLRSKVQELQGTIAAGIEGEAVAHVQDLLTGARAIIAKVSARSDIVISNPVFLEDRYRFIDGIVKIFGRVSVRSNRPFDLVEACSREAIGP